MVWEKMLKSVLSSIEHRSTAMPIGLAQILQLAPNLGNAALNLVLLRTASTHQQLRLNAVVLTAQQRGSFAKQASNERAFRIY